MIMATACLYISPQHLEESLNNVFYLPSTEQTIRYLHACAGFPTRRTWTKAIKKGNFISWPLLTVENVNQHFSESEETVKGHMSHQRQGVCSTKPKDFQDTPYLDKPEGCVLFVPQNSQIFIFSNGLLTILHAVYLVSNKVASNQAKITVFLHLS